MSSSIAAAGLQGCPDPRIEKDLLQPKKKQRKGRPQRGDANLPNHDEENNSDEQEHVERPLDNQGMDAGNQNFQEFEMISDELDALNRPQPELEPEGFDAGDNGQVDVANVANVANNVRNNLDEAVLAERAISHLIVMAVTAVHSFSDGQTQLN